MIKTILTVLFVLVCIALTVIVLLQEGKAGLGSLAGGNSGDSFWGKNKVVPQKENSQISQRF